MQVMVEDVMTRCPAAVSPQATVEEVLNTLVTEGLASVYVTTAENRLAGVVTDYALLARPWNIPLHEIEGPVHCWHGTADTLVPLAHTEALIERLPNARLTTWPGEGHLALIPHIGEVLTDIAGG